MKKSFMVIVISWKQIQNHLSGGCFSPHIHGDAFNLQIYIFMICFNEIRNAKKIFWQKQIESETSRFQRLTFDGVNKSLRR